MLISKSLFPTETANSLCLLQELEQETCPEGRNCLKTNGIKGVEYMQKSDAWIYIKKTRVLYHKMGTY